MPMKRAQLVVLAISFFLSFSGVSALSAAEFPQRTISFIIPYPPGGIFDVYSRMIIPSLEKTLGVTVQPVNVTGGNGIRGATQVFRAKPDGYTIGIFSAPGIFLPPLIGQKVDYDPHKYTWISTLGHQSYAMGVLASSPIKSVADLKALPRKVKFGGLGPGSSAYIATQIGIRTPSG